MAPKNKINLKDRLEDGELDLSLSELEEVPVREIALMKKATSLDLSNNRLVSLSKNFITLTNIIKLDLSKNLLGELPENFGDLKQLKHLDLYSNKLTHLPLSFHQLKALKWLDLKGNPLVPTVEKVAGPCLNAQQCSQCAKNIVIFFTKLCIDIEDEKRKREAEYQVELEAQAANLKKQQKKKEKNKALKAKKSKLKAELKAEAAILFDDSFIDYSPDFPVHQNGIEKSKKPSKPSNNTCYSLIKILFYTFLLSSASLFIFTSLKNNQALTIKMKIIIIWDHFVSNSIPKGWQPVAIKFSEHVGTLHTETGVLSQNIVGYLQDFKKNEKLQDIFNKFTETTVYLGDFASEGLAILGKQMIVLKNEVHRIIVEHL